MHVDDHSRETILMTLAGPACHRVGWSSLSILCGVRWNIRLRCEDRLSAGRSGVKEAVGDVAAVNSVIPLDPDEAPFPPSL